MICAARIVGVNETIGINKGLQAFEIGIPVFLVVDFDADVQLRRHRSRIQAQLPGILGQCLVPWIDIGDAANG